MTNFKLIKFSGMACVLFAGMMSSCKKDASVPASIIDEDLATAARATYSSRTVNFDNRSDGTYTSSEASSDFGNVSGWDDSNAYNSNGTCWPMHCQPQEAWSQTSTFRMMTLTKSLSR
jgi:hypothetical protein